MDVEKFIKVFPNGLSNLKDFKSNGGISFSDIGKLMFLSMSIQRDTGMIVNSDGSPMSITEMANAIGDNRQNFHKTLKVFINSKILQMNDGKYFVNKEYAQNTCNSSDSKFTVYRFVDSNGFYIYVGKSKKGIDARIKQHISDGHLPRECYDSISYIEYISVPTKLDMDILEKYFIGKYEPQWNIVDNGHGVTTDVNDNYVWTRYSKEVSL